MFTCSCCTPFKSYISKKSLHRHEKKYNKNYVPYEKPTSAKDKYELNPKVCACCGLIIPFDPSCRKRIYCSRSCAATVNNIIPKRVVSDKSKKNRKLLNRNDNRKLYTFHGCKKCGTAVKNQNSTFCSVQCFSDNEWELFKNNKASVWTPRRLKRYLVESQGRTCSRCNRSEWEGVPIPIELEHIDGNSENNAINNVCLLCPNCHALTPTYKSKNIGNGRAFRRKRYAQGKSW
jgi:hypothetical protein